MTARTPARALALLLALVALPAVAAPAPAAAQSPSTCIEGTKARPGMVRTHIVWCAGATAVELVRGPSSGTVSRQYPFSGEYYALHWQPSGPADEEIEVRATFADRTATVTLPIDVIPLTENTPPFCSSYVPGSASSTLRQRTAGTEPAVFKLPIGCGDAENDKLTVHADGGPGTHLDAPQAWDTFDVTAGWRYRTAATSGTETASVVPVDELGARGDRVDFQLEFGAAVDDPATCMLPGDGMPATKVDLRPDRPRRFVLLCRDGDGDPVSARVAAPPAQGTLVIERDAPVSRPGYRAVELLYTPSAPLTGDVPFTLGLGGQKGTDEQALVLHPVDTGAIGSISCVEGGGGRWLNTDPGVPVELRMRCVHSLGDAFTATITKAPVRGTLTPVTTGADGFGVQDVVTTFRTDATPSTEEVEIQLRSPSGNGTYALSWTIATFNSAPPFPLPPVLPGGGGGGGPVPAPAPGPTSGRPPVVPAPTPAEGRRHAQRLLGTQDVGVVKTIRGARVYADRKAWRSGLRAAGTKPALVVACTRACQVESSVRLELRGVAARGSAATRVARQRAAGASDTPVALRLGLSRADRVRVRRARTARAAFAVKVVAGGQTGRATLRAKLRG